LTPGQDEQEVRIKILTWQSRKKLRQIEKRMHRLTQRMLEAQERERNAIGRELHDELGGYLAVLGLSLSQMAKEPEKNVWLEQIRQTVDEMTEHVRDLLHKLYPSVLERDGLLVALAAYIENYQRRTGIRVYFYQKWLEDRMPFQIEACAYRIIQEALTNVAKHAAVDSTKVTILRMEDIVKIIVQDKGCGFDISQVKPTAYGIAGMKDRALIAGGSLFVDSSPGRGTRVTCTLPIPDMRQ
jgi:signal transduction histidine kinase